MNTLKESPYFMILCLSFMLSAFSFAQTSKQYDYIDFNSIEISSAFTADITQSHNYRLTIECDEGMESYLDVELEGNELSIGLKSWRGKSIKKLIAHIELPDLKKLELSGATSTTITNFKIEDVEIELSGASTLNAKLEGKQIELEASGASTINLDGHVQKMKLYLSGASNFSNENANISDELLLDCSGASIATMNVDGDMYIKLSGASTFNYAGEGVIVKQEVTGASSVHKK